MSIPSQEQVSLLTDYDINSAFSKAYQKLYANISFAWEQNQTPQQTVLFVTPAPYAGQSAVPANVAIAAAQSGTPAILVDANLHRSTLEQRFRTGRNPGLSDLLTSNSSFSIASVLCDTFVPNLKLLGTGTADLQEISMVYSHRLNLIIADLRTFLAQTEQVPSMVIFNSPAVLASSEALLISNAVNKTFLTISTGRTTKRQARQAQDQLRHTHGTLEGVVMLDV